jgi:hypothetical protein
MARIRAQLTDQQGRFPSRRTCERRLDRLAGLLPLRIALLGTWLLRRLVPWPHGGRTVAIDSTCLRARWRLAQEASRGGRSAAHQYRHRGGVDQVGLARLGIRLEVARRGHRLGHGVVALAADLTPANVADNEQAPLLLVDLPAEISAVLGDQHYNDPALHALVTEAGRLLITTNRGAYPHTDDGVEVRRLFHQLRSHAVENFNAQFKTIFGCLGNVPTRGLVPTRRFALGAVLLYQLTLWHHAIADRDLRQGIKPFLLSA